MSVKSFDPSQRGEVVRCGLLKKLKTSRKKWFVLRAETPESSARLEYYDSERKFNSGLPPKRSIPLRTCFNINKRNDTKHKNVIALYTKDDCFCMVLDSEEELDVWLKALLSLQHGEEAADGETPRPTFEHVWQVAILNRGLGTGRIGNYRLCLTDKTLTLIKKDGENSVIDLNLSNIRSCGSLRNYFFLEIGRSSQLGAGELWMDSEDTNIAQNIHTTIFHAMSTNSKRDEMEPKIRIRSSSATESSKPNNVYRKQPPMTGIQKQPHIFQQGIMGGRERCDSMPSRPRATSESTHPIPVWRLVPHHRSQCRDISHSPPSGSPVSPPSVGCSTDSTGSSYSLADEIDVCTECPENVHMYSIPLTPDGAIVEEDCVESPCGIYDSYVPMAPQSSDDGYVDMSPRCPHNTASPSASMSSVTSGTPSTDFRFSDYPLDKVSSYFTSEDDDARPARAYSVGSRPETCRSKRHMELAFGTPENSRVRAFSVGSKTKKGPCRVLPPHYPHPGAKSSSAPILSNSRTHSSHGSIGPMDDLMEMDFSRSNTGSSTNSEYTEMKLPVNKTPSGYVEMKPGGSLSQVRVNSGVDETDNSPYVDMSGSSPARNHVTSPPEEYNSFVDVTRQYHRLSAHEPARNNNYVDMDQRKNRTYSTSSANTRASTSPGSYQWRGDYLDMSANNARRSDRGSINSQVSSSPTVSVSPKNDSIPVNTHQLDATKLPENQLKTPEGYVEMNLGSKKHQRQSSLDSNQIRGNDDYTNMSLGSAGATAKKKPIRKEKTRSQPISINPTTTSSQVTKNSSSPISISSLLGRKSSTGTPPRMHLPLSSWATASSYSSLPRQRPRKDSHNNSKDSSSSSLTTPSSSSTIFPMSLNSPSSPMRPNKAETPAALKIPAAILNAIYKTNNKSVGAKSKPGDDYTLMDFEVTKTKPSKVEELPSDYVNYDPAIRTPAKAVSKPESMDETPGDYAVMRPGVIESDQVMGLPLGSPSAASTSPLVAHLSCIGIDESQAMCFRPIKEDTRLGSISPRPGDTVPTKLTEDSKTTDTATTEGVESPYETLRSMECVSPAAKISRPNSVNGDKIKSTSPRPSLVSCDKSRPSSVSSDTPKGATSRPSSTSSELCSSTSTLVSSRPESVNSDCVRSDPATSQPIKTDVQLHYASLDLAQMLEDDGSRSPRTAKSSPNEAGVQAQCEPTFIYAEIDFLKSEGLKHNNPSLPSNTKVKH